MSTDGILTSLEDRVYTITLNEPERYNPLSRARYAAIGDALDEADATDARCVVIEGAGEAFSSGGDMESTDEEPDEPPSIEDDVAEIQAHENGVVGRVVEFPMPTVAKVDGLALGDGAALGLACDLTLASERTRIAITHVRFGLSMDAAASWLLPRFVGEKAAKELALTGRMVESDEALDLGLVNHVYPVDEFEARADEVIDRLGRGPPLALRHIKRLVGDGLDRSLEDALREEAFVQAAMFRTDDFAEGVRAFREDRRPEFRGR